MVGNRSSARNDSHHSNDVLSDYNSTSTATNPRSLLLQPGLDMWRRSGGLSVTRLTFQYLISGFHTLSELADLQNCNIRTIRRHLKKLESVGLTVNADAGKWEALYRDPDEVAEQLGTSEWDSNNQSVTELNGSNTHSGYRRRRSAKTIQFNGFLIVGTTGVAPTNAS